MSRSLCFQIYSADEIEENLKNKPGFNPTLGIIFSSTAVGIPELTSEVRRLEIPVFGCSTSGEILPYEDDSPTHDFSAVCCFLDPEPSQFAIALFDRTTESSTEFGNKIGAFGKDTFKMPAFIISLSGLNNNYEEIIRGIAEICPEKTPIYGGIAGDDGRFEETFVFTNSGYSTSGAAVIVFDRSRVQIEGMATSGWTGVGIEMVITSSDENIVYTINHRPATRVFKEYLNVDEDMLNQIGITFPLLIKREDGSEVLRTFLSVDHEKEAMIFGCSIPQGTKVRFSSSFGYEIIDKSIAEIHDFYTHHQKADMVLLFSCMARHRVAGSMAENEINAAGSLWNAPLIGFFSYGEIGNNKTGTCDFYNETLSLVLIRYTS